jgi:hypothetical protein
MKWVYTSESLVDSDDNKWILQRKYWDNPYCGGRYVWYVYKIVDGIRAMFVDSFDTITQAKVYCEIHGDI